MYINTADKRINITVSDLVSVSCRMRERFRKFDNALKDDPSFAVNVAEAEYKRVGNNYYPNITSTIKYIYC